MFFEKPEGSAPEKLLMKNNYDTLSEAKIVEVGGKRLVAAENQGFSAEVPQNWIFKNYGAEIDLLSPENEPDKPQDILKNARENGACNMGIELSQSEIVAGQTSLAQEVLSMAEGLEKYPASSSQEPAEDMFLVSGKKSWRTIHKRDGEVRLITVETPAGDRVFSFTTGLIINQKCVDYFYRILSSVRID